MFIFYNTMLASFRPAKSNGFIFTDSLSNDILLQTHNTNQNILFGFGSNRDSTVKLTNSNLTIDKGGLYASNIGIGVSSISEGYRLHVAGDVRVDGDIVVSGTATILNTDVQVTDQFSVSNAGTGTALIVSQNGNYDIAEFIDDNTVVMRIANGGGVMIGSGTPTTKLDVEGDTTIRGSIYTSNIDTSNIETNSITSTFANLTTTTTSSLYSSNLIINNQVIINSNGIITNSNLIPPLNTSNIVAGAFTSNFIHNDNITSSKLTSNLTLKGTTTLTSNLYVNGGDVHIYGLNNFTTTGEHARAYLGSDSYFVGSTKNVGIVMQVPGTTYPFVLENNTGFLGIGTMDPDENLHIGSNIKVDGSAYVMTNIGIGTSNPSKALHVIGDILTNSNVQSSVGTLGPIFSLISENAFADISSNQKLILNHTLEAGNPATNIKKSLFYGNSFLYQDASGEDMKWNCARLLFRGCPLTTSPSLSTMTVQDFIYSRIPQYSNIISPFTLSNDGSDYGFVTYATPWFSSTTNDARHLALVLNENDDNANFRIGQVLIQFKA
jgi:hypothetical protein